ncbi:hypothetical protein LOK49_LG07G03713 [Camellia lanceoleosa]|uniref:Uncharacterized protein n=1 Tax=Camellia lanceoleosa TaxID=1840588 RepID=A0ACC0H1T3_9ERIC|nr:hypothetical protein LOK49_LG07G03713 [Camellia lanceoleosa]
MHCKESKELEEGVLSWNDEDSDYEESDYSKGVARNKEIIIQIDDVLKPDKDYDRKNDSIKYAGYEEESYDGHKSLDGQISSNNSHNSSNDESYANEKSVVVVELGKLKADVPCMKTHPLFHLEIVSKEKIPKSDNS